MQLRLQIEVWMFLKRKIANRSMDVLEKENRIRAEILKGRTTLSEVTEVLKWEKK